ncbi:DBH-like monooxygenase protein 2 homolog [Sycon ciliatum]|uniref:DBH-like monooxygenase protein 2 homolog n=1 Tax=Sycon ciliatum TaxID=27933 RepID=UPI0031F6C16E
MSAGVLAPVTALLLACVAIRQVQAFATYRSRIPNGFSVQHPCDAARVWHGVGHVSEQGGDARNRFGLDFLAEGRAWTMALCRNDSDGDGQSNGEELGDPDCVWTPGQTAARTVNITHPGFKTPVGQHAYSSQDPTTLDCTRLLKRCPAFDAPGVQYIDLRAENGSDNTIVPAQETTYFNMNFELPSDRQYHAVGFAPLLDNLNVIHHFTMMGCKSPVPTGQGYESFNVLPGCETTIYVWSFGLGDECMPEAAGVPFGGRHPRYVQVQLHWTNADLVPDYRDRSGVRMYYTSQLRPHDMGTMTLGQVNIDIPPGQTEVELPFRCTSDCTKTLLDQGPIQLTVSFPHMHFLGSAMYVDLIKEGGNRTRIMDDHSYNYNSPVTYEYAPSYVQVARGDVFESRCVFNSVGRNQTTRWGFGSFDEMCFAFIRYFPSRGELVCNQFGQFDLCYQSSFVEGPRCSVFSYTENITVAVNNAMRECSDVMQAVAMTSSEGTAIMSTATTTVAPVPVCSAQCLAQASRVLRAHRDPCQQTRHPDEWRLLNRLIRGSVSSLEGAVHHCETVGLVNDSSAARMPASVALFSLALLIALSHA